MSRDHVSIPQQNLLWVALMGVGLLTFAFVLGVQVGKQGAALRGPKVKTLDDEIKELPEPLHDQLRALETTDADPRPPLPPNPEPHEDPQERWTLQLISTKDPDEAKKIAEKARSAGFKTITVNDHGLHKVRLEKSDRRAVVDKQAEKLKKAGVKPFAVRVE